jgi:hypothetical protein
MYIALLYDDITYATSRQTYYFRHVGMSASFVLEQESR